MTWWTPCRNLYEVTDIDGSQVLIVADDDYDARWQAKRNHGMKRPGARLWRSVQCEDPADLDRLLAAAVAEWENEGESAASARSPDVVSGRPENEDNAATTRPSEPDNAADARLDAGMDPERNANVDSAQERRLQPTVPARRPPIISNKSNRGGRPIKATKLLLDPVMVDYYRHRDGLQQDLEYLLVQTGIGPAGLARSLGVDRDRIHDWRAHGMPKVMDPLVFWTIVTWITALRSKWPWQR